MKITPKELQKRIELERAKIARDNDFLIFKRKIEAQRAARIRKLEHRILNPQSILSHNDFLEEFCKEVDQLGRYFNILTAPEKKMMQGIFSFGNYKSLKMEKREKIIDIAKRIAACASENGKT